MNAERDYRELKEWLEKTEGETLEEMSLFFKDRLDGYEQHMAYWQPYYRWMSELLPASVENLLDIGCGTGLELDEIFQKNPRIRVTGVDLSADMLGKLQQKHRDKSLTLVCADYFLYDMGIGVFDAAVSFETLHHFDAGKKRALFEKIYHSLKPGGVYLECDYIASSQALEELTFAECRRRRIRDNIPDDVFVHFDTPLTLEHEMQAMKDAGFSRVELVGFRSEDHHTAMIQAVK